MSLNPVYRSIQSCVYYAQMKFRIPTPQEMADMRARGEGIANRAPCAAEVAEKRAERKITKRIETEAEKLQDQMEEKFRNKPGSQRGHIMELFETFNFDPARELIMLAKRGELTNDQQIKVLTTLLEFTTPRLKAVEVSGTVDHQMTVIIERYGDDGKVIREKLPMPKNSVVSGTTQAPVAIIDAEVVK